jgi:hypothetical protein
MISSFFDFHGVTLRVSAGDAKSRHVLGQICRDFHHFHVPSFAQLKTESFPIPVSMILLGTSGRAPFRQGLPIFKTKMAKVSGFGWQRVCDYGGGTLVESRDNARTRTFHVQSTDEHELYEAAYLAILSAVGETLDVRGFHRIHGLGFSAAGRAGILAAPAGAGKSALGYLLLAMTDERVYSDEMPLLRDGLVYPYPTRLALRPQLAAALGADVKNCRLFKRKIYPEKFLIDFPAERVAAPAPCEWFLIGQKTTGRPQIFSATKRETFSALMRSCVVGLGLAQMAEYVIRFPSLLTLAAVAVSRFQESMKILKTTPAFIFEMSENPYDNFRVLCEFTGIRPNLPMRDGTLIEPENFTSPS